MLRPASMRLAISISPSRESSSIVPISRRYMRTGRRCGRAPPRSATASSSPSAASAAAGSPSAAGSASRGLGLGVAVPASSLRTADALRIEQLDHLVGLLRREIRRQRGVELIERDGATLLGLHEQAPQLRVALQERLEAVTDVRLGDGLAAHGRVPCS